jgi:type IV secretion system protein VirB10
LLLVLSPITVPLAASDTVLPEGTRITLQLNNNLSTKSNSEGDSFTAVVTMPVYSGERMVIPKGSVVSGSISRIDRPGRVKGKAVLYLQFQSIRIPGRRQAPIYATLVRVDFKGNGGVQSEGSVAGAGSTGSDMAKVLTPGLVGAGIGTLAGGGKGAGIGAGVGVAIGLAAVFTSRGKDLDVRRGSTMEISLDRPWTVPPESEASAARNR